MSRYIIKSTGVVYQVYDKDTGRYVGNSYHEVKIAERICDERNVKDDLKKLSYLKKGVLKSHF